MSPTERHFLLLNGQPEGGVVDRELGVKHAWLSCTGGGGGGGGIGRNKEKKNYISTFFANVNTNLLPADSPILSSLLI